MKVNLHQAKTHLSRLVDRASAGEEIVLAKAGKPVARLVALEPPLRKKRKLGLLEGKIRIPDDFNRDLPARLLDLFEGRKARKR